MKLIDRFAINVTIPVGMTERVTYFGIFGLAEVDISLTLRCVENYYDASCNRFCNESDCTCDPGFTGPFCTESIDDCEGVTCNGTNQICIDEHRSHRCVCEPGFTGDDCDVDIDECADMSCMFGTCVEGVGFFTCVCRPGYTGQFCDTKLDGYKLQVMIESVRNPEGQCADSACNDGQVCCDGTRCPRGRCHYYLHYCLRPAGTPVSFLREEHQGNCRALNTQTERLNSVDIRFSYSMLTLTGPQWVS